MNNALYAFLVMLSRIENLLLTIFFGKVEEITEVAPTVVREVRHRGGVWTGVRIRTYYKRKLLPMKSGLRLGWRFIEVPTGYERFLYQDNLTEDIGAAVANVFEIEEIIKNFSAGNMNA